jgi:O-antigen ligase
LISIIAVLINEVLLIPIFVLAFVSIILSFKKKLENIYIIIIVSFLALTSTINTELRAMVQALGIGILFYLFFKEYGFSFITYPRIPKVLYKFIIFLFFSVCLSIIFSHYKIIGLIQLQRLLIFLAVVYLLYSALYNNITIKTYLTALFITCLIYMGFTFYTFYKSGFSLIEINLNQLNKIQEDYLNVNSMGAFFVLVYLILLPFAITKIKIKAKKYILMFLVLMILSLIILNSRASILALSGGMIFLLYKLNKKILLILFLIVILLLPLIFIEPFSTYIDIYFRLERLSTGRDIIYQTIYYVIRDNILFGAGPAGTKYELYRNLPFMLGSPEELYISHHMNMIEFGHAHNFYLFLLSDMGICGLLVSLFLPAVFFRINISVIKKYKELDQNIYLLSLGIMAAGIAFFIRGIFEWGNILSYGTLGSDLPFWILVAILIYLNQKRYMKMDMGFISP